LQFAKITAFRAQAQNRQIFFNHTYSGERWVCCADQRTRTRSDYAQLLVGHGAYNVLLATWRKGKAVKFYSLRRSAWREVDNLKDIFASRKLLAGK